MLIFRIEARVRQIRQNLVEGQVDIFFAREKIGSKKVFSSDDPTFSEFKDVVHRARQLQTLLQFFGVEAEFVEIT